MPLHRLAVLTFPEVAALDRDRTVAVLPVGAIEAHGPHLPLDTDVRIAEAMAEAAAAALGGRHEILLLPAIAYTPAGFAAGFAGTLEIDEETLVAQLTAIGRSLLAHGFRRLAIANAHFDPANVGALRRAVRTCEALGMVIAFPDATRRALASRLGEEFASGACHAGCYETSLLLAIAPELVRRPLANALAPLPISLSTAIRQGAGRFEAIGASDAYVGDPAAASSEEGRVLVATLGTLLAEAIRDLDHAGPRPASAR